MKITTECNSLSDHVSKHIKAILVDIEGTTTPISFVTEVLFPYVTKNIESYLQKKWGEKEAQDDVEALRALAKEDIENKVSDVPVILGSGDEGVKESIIKNVHWQMSQDRKSTALKQLQGHMWRSAYKDGSIKGEVYADVPIVLKQLKNDGKDLYVYSSGSVQAQKLLFEHSNAGNLDQLFRGNFDTKVGNKRESASYAKIAKSIEKKPQEVLFLTDVVAEAEAAEEAGMKVCVLLRPGNKPLSEEDLKKFSTIESFDELVDDGEVPSKCAKIEQNLENENGNKSTNVK